MLAGVDDTRRPDGTRRSDGADDGMWDDLAEGFGPAWVELVADYDAAIVARVDAQLDALSGPEPGGGVSDERRRAAREAALTWPYEHTRVEDLPAADRDALRTVAPRLDADSDADSDAEGRPRVSWVISLPASYRDRPVLGGLVLGGPVPGGLNSGRQNDRCDGPG